MKFPLPCFLAITGACFLFSCGKEEAPVGQLSRAKLIPGLDISQVERFSIQQGADVRTIGKDSDRWVLVESSERIPAFPPLVQAVLILLETLPAGQGRVLDERFLERMGIDYGQPNSECVRLKLFSNQQAEPYILDFGDFDDNYDQESAEVIGEKHVRRRSVYCHLRKKLFLVRYPFNEMKPDLSIWFDGNFTLSPRYLKTVEISKGEQTEIGWKREKPFGSFHTSSTSEKSPRLLQKTLSAFLSEGTFFLPVLGEQKQLVEKPFCSIAMEDFNGHRFVLAVGETYVYSTRKKDEGRPGTLSLLEERKDPEVLCRAVHYRSYLNRADEQANQPQDDYLVFVDNKDIKTLLDTIKPK